MVKRRPVLGNRLAPNSALQKMQCILQIDTPLLATQLSSADFLNSAPPAASRNCRYPPVITAGGALTTTPNRTMKHRRQSSLRLVWTGHWEAAIGCRGPGGAGKAPSCCWAAVVPNHSHLSSPNPLRPCRPSSPAPAVARACLGRWCLVCLPCSQARCSPCVSSHSMSLHKWTTLLNQTVQQEPLVSPGLIGEAQGNTTGALCLGMHNGGEDDCALAALAATPFSRPQGPQHTYLNIIPSRRSF